MHIYFLVAEEHNYIKIGTTTQPNNRFRVLCKENNPHTIYMILIKNSVLSEIELHDINSYCHKTREWFTGNNKLFTLIQELYDSHDSIVINKVIEQSIKKSSKVKDRIIEKTNYHTFKIQDTVTELNKVLYMYNNNIY